MRGSISLAVRLFPQQNPCNGMSILSILLKVSRSSLQTFFKEHHKIYGYIGFAWQGFDSGRATGVVSVKKLLKGSPMSNRANASQLQDGPATGQG